MDSFGSKTMLLSRMRSLPIPTVSGLKGYEMSIKSWKQEFYPITAEQAARKGDLAAIDHAYLKFRGTFPSNLKRHGCEKWKCRVLFDDLEFCFGHTTCALCVRNTGPAFDMPDCYRCPLFVSGGIECSQDESAYREWEESNDPRPMLKALRAARKLVLK